MAWEQNPYAIKVSLVSAADYNTTSKQFYFVTVTAPGTGSTTPTATLVASATAKPVGVLQNAPKAGFEAEVTVSGITKVVAGGTIAVGDQIGSDGNGKAVTLTAGTDTTKYVVGTALSAGVSGDVITVAISCPGAHRAA